MSFDAEKVKNKFICMIVKLKGFIEDWFEDFVDLDVKGVVYRVFVPRNINKISD